MALNSYLKQFFYTPHTKPVLLDCSFVVDNTTNIGISSFKGQGVTAVYMHSTGTPAPGTPVVAPGYIVVQIKGNANSTFGGFQNIISPLSGTNLNISGTGTLTVGEPYIITSTGSSTQANWQAVGLPSSVNAAPGVPFVASVTGGGTGTGLVQAAGNSGIVRIEQMETPNFFFAANMPGQGAYFFFQCLGATSATSTTLIPTAPTQYTTIQLAFYLSDSSVTVNGS